MYLDTSAYLCILLAEEGWHELSEKTDDAEVLSSVLLVLEAKRNLIRLAREGTLKPDVYKVCMDRLDADTARLVFRDLTLDLCQSAHSSSRQHTPFLRPRAPADGDVVSRGSTRSIIS